MGDEAAEPASASVRRPCPTVMTIGHSTRPFDAFVELLKEHDVALVADIRTVPRSRHNPQYGIDILRATLPAAGIAYRHLPGLGGLRRATGEDTNIGWHNLSFRGYADYMQTVEFTIALDELIDLAHDVRLAIMCAEAVPWRCHRSLVADALLLRGLDVRHIMGPAKSIVASLTRFAHVDGPMLTYPAQP
jgi:uncharacterized protein (DUF488 family)